MASRQKFLNAMFGRGPTQMECCAHCDAMSEAASLRCPSCQKFRRPVLAPFLCAPALMAGLFLWAVFLTKVAPTLADMAAGCGQKLPGFLLLTFRISGILKPIMTPIIWAVWCSPLVGLFLFPRRARGTRLLLLLTLSCLLTLGAVAIFSITAFARPDSPYLCYVRPSADRP